MTATYEMIQKNILTSSQSSVTFNSISSAYTDLVIIINGAMNAGENSLGMRFNGDTGSNYGTTAFYGDGVSTASFRFTSLDRLYVGRASVTGNSTSIIDIQNYKNTSVYKTVLSKGSSPSINMATVGLWMSTAAINSIYISDFGTNSFIAGTTFTIYGIKAE